MAETKEEIAAERDSLRAENDALRAELESLRQAGAPAVPRHRFMLSEGDRQELATRGVVNVGGKLMHVDDVRALLEDDQRGVNLGDAIPVDEV